MLGIRKYVLAVMGLVCSIGPCLAAFAIFQTYTVALTPAVTTCNIVTGIATGLDAGTCASPAATCNGVANDRAAFNAFNTWANATTTNANGQLLELYVPSGSTCIWNSDSVSS